jgi:predicted XRE-type DNA-binding protein
MKKTAPVKRGSGNVFKDLGFRDAETLLLKAQIVAAIGDIIHEQGLTQTAAARKMRLKQPDVSRLLDGRTDGFSLERLFNLLVALGQRVLVEAQPANENLSPTEPRLVFAHA